MNFPMMTQRRKSRLSTKRVSTAHSIGPNSQRGKSNKIRLLNPSKLKKQSLLLSSYRNVKESLNISLATRAADLKMF